MRRLAVLAVLLCAVTAGSARANTFGQHIPASPLRGGNNEFGVYLLLDNETGLLGQVRFSSSPKLDWGLQGGFVGGSDTEILLGGDIRPILHAADDEFPVDVAFDAGIGLGIADHVTLLRILPSIEGSHRFPLSGSDGALTPYMSVGLGINHVSVDGGGDNTDTNVNARFGLEWEATRKIGVIGEFGAGDGTTDFTLGVNVPF